MNHEPTPANLDAKGPCPEQLDVCSPGSPSRTIGHYRWFICALLLFATTINYVDRQILALLKPVLDSELGWTNEQFGLVNSVFQAAYGLGLLWFGWFIDRVGTKTGYFVSVLVWSLSAIGHALVGSVAGFRWARVSLGLAEAGNWPAAVKAVAEWFPQKERTFATSLFNAGTMVGAIIAPASVPYIAQTMGWRAAFVLGGAAGFIWLGLWARFYQAPAKQSRLSPSELAYIQGDREAEDGRSEIRNPKSETNPKKWKIGNTENEDGDVGSAGASPHREICPPPASNLGDCRTESGTSFSWLELLRYPQTWSFAVGKFMTDPVWWFYLIWLPDFFHKTKGLDLKGLGPPIVVIYSIATILSILGARLGDLLVQRGWRASTSRKVCMLVFVLCELPILLQVKGAGLWGAVMWIGLAAGVHQAWSANLFTSVSDMFPKQAVASVIGLGGMAGCVSGMMFPIFAGRILDKFVDSGNANTGYAVLFAICGSAYLVAFALNHLCAPRFEQIRLKRLNRYG